MEVTGTNFTLEVSEDGTTTLTVLDGKVEFSDKEEENCDCYKLSDVCL